MKEKKYTQICSRCIYDNNVPNISFDEQGVCNYCRMFDGLIEEYGTGNEKGEKAFKEIVEQIKKDGKGKQYDCVIGVSGGTDSSYLVYLAKQWGLRPLAVHYDNTWNSAISTENIRKVLGALKVDLYTHVVDNKEMDDIYKAFVKADVPEIEATTDLALVETLYRAASKYKIKYIVEGHSFLTEGITPLNKNYFDGRYIRSIHKLYGTRPMKTYPLMDFTAFMKWIIVKRIKRIRPFWYIKYSKEEARAFLEKEFGWTYYGGHHLENRMTAFFHSYYLPQKFNMDMRSNSLSASVRLGKRTRESAMEEYYHTEPYLEPELLNYFKKRLNYSDKEFEDIIRASPKYWWMYPTYKKRFERLRPLFAVLTKMNLVPKSFYLKYCFPATTQ